MTDALNVPAGEIGKVRLFALNMPPEQAKFLREPGAADGVLGVLQVDQAYVEVFPVRDLEGVGLSGYLADGCGIPADQLAPDRDRLAALTGYVMIVLSRAFGGRAVTLHPTSDIRLIATYSEEPTDWTAAPLPIDSALPRAGAPQSPRTARTQARRIGGTVFAVFMVLVVLLVWMVAT